MAETLRLDRGLGLLQATAANVLVMIERNVPRAILLSIAIVVLLYVVMSTVIVGVIPWTEAQQTRAIASLFIARTVPDPATGRAAAIVMTALILFVTASSLYAVILG
jgi:fructoselysine transporter